MKGYREIVTLEEMPAEYLADGHFWIQEYVHGVNCWFEMDEAGMLSFGDDSSAFDPEGIPPHYRPAVEHVRSTLDRDRLRAGTDDVEAYTFAGVAPVSGGPAYDWERIPPFLGIDIWDETAGGFVTVDVAERVFESIGLSLAPIIEKEVPARQFSPGTYDFPDSAYAPTEVPGVVLRKKNGEPAIHRRIRDADESGDADRGSPDESIETWLEETLTEARVRDLAEAHDITVEGADTERLTQVIAGEIARREYGRLADVLERKPQRVDSAVRERVTEIRGSHRY